MLAKKNKCKRNVLGRCAAECHGLQAASAVSLLAGLVADWLHKDRGWSLVSVRRLCQNFASLGGSHINHMVLVLCMLIGDRLASTYPKRASLCV